MRLPFNGTFRLTQGFAENPDAYARFNMKGHNGRDYGLPVGTPVLAPHGGKVIEATFDADGYGIYVKIENEVGGSVLAHLSRRDVNPFQVVYEGQQIGLSGNTGNSTGPHLHWGYYLFPRNRANGYNGFIDQGPLLAEQTATPKPAQQGGGTTNMAVPMTPAEAAQAYRDTLGREPESEAVTQGRTRDEFYKQACVELNGRIKRIEGELADDRTKAAAQIATLTTEMDALKKQLASLQDHSSHTDLPFTELHQEVTITADKGLTLRSDVKVSPGNTLAVFKKGAKLTMLGYLDGEEVKGQKRWLKIEHDGLVGFVWAGGTSFQLIESEPEPAVHAAAAPQNEVIELPRVHKDFAEMVIGTETYAINIETGARLDDVRPGQRFTRYGTFTFEGVEYAQSMKSHNKDLLIGVPNADLRLIEESATALSRLEDTPQNLALAHQISAWLSVHIVNLRRQEDEPLVAYLTRILFNIKPTKEQPTDAASK